MYAVYVMCTSVHPMYRVFILHVAYCASSMQFTYCVYFRVDLSIDLIGTLCGLAFTYCLFGFFAPIVYS